MKRRLKPTFSAKLLIGAAEEELPIEEQEQAYSGRNTSLTPEQMRGRLPALFKKAIPWPTGGRVFDIGAGRPEMVEAVKAWFAEKNIKALSIKTYQNLLNLTHFFITKNEFFKVG